MPDQAQRRYGPAGYQVLATSVPQLEGLAALRDLLRGRESVLAGQSGVGKSSLLNALQPGLDLRIGDISRKWDTGKHTTSAALVVAVAGGYVVDTPGLREIGTWGIDPELLAACFPELLLRERWESQIEAYLVRDYHDWLAPALLTHTYLKRATRERLERAACRQAEKLYRVRPLLPEVINADLVDVAMIEAMLRRAGK